MKKLGRGYGIKEPERIEADNALESNSNGRGYATVRYKRIEAANEVLDKLRGVDYIADESGFWELRREAAIVINRGLEGPDREEYKSKLEDHED